MTDAPRTDPSDSPLNGFLGYALKRALSVVQSDLSITLTEFGLRATSFSALLVVVDRPGITQTDLADALAIERSNLVQIIDELCNSQRIARTPVKGDRRRHALMPTAQGLVVAAQAKAAVQAHEARIFAVLSAGERAELALLLSKLRNAGALRSIADQTSASQSST